MARTTSGTGSNTKTTTTKTRATRGGVTGTLVKTTTTSSKGSSSKPKMTYKEYAAKGGNVAAAKKYNASKKTTESFRADAPAKMESRPAYISPPKTTQKLAGSKMKTYPPPTPKKNTITTGGSGKGKSKGKLKKKVKRAVVSARNKMGAKRNTAPKRTSNRKLSCRGATCKRK